MLLNDKEYSLQEISEKTNITIENLEKLQNREWDKFKRPHAIGLISIIEREFDVDMSAVKMDANNYYEQHQNSEPNRIIDMVDAQTVGGAGNKIISNIITVVTLCAIAYAGWYYFIDKQGNSISVENNQSSTESSSGMFANTIESVKKLLGGSDGSKVKAVVENNNTQEPKEENTIKTDEPKESNNSSEVNSIETKEITEDKPKKFDITTVAQDNTTEIEAKQEKVVIENSTKQEELNSNSENLTQNNDEAQSVTTETKDNEKNGSVKGEVDKLLAELDSNNSQKDVSQAEEANQKSETLTENSVDTDANASEVNTSEFNLTDTNTSVISNIEFKIKSKSLWLGIYNLTNGKRIVKTARKKYDLNIGDDKLAIITGHNRFEIVTENGIKKFTKRGRIYLLVSKDEIKEISKKEYKTITKRRAW